MAGVRAHTHHHRVPHPYLPLLFPPHPRAWHIRAPTSCLYRTLCPKRLYRQATRLHTTRPTRTASTLLMGTAETAMMPKLKADLKAQIMMLLRPRREVIRSQSPHTLLQVVAAWGGVQVPLWVLHRYLYQNGVRQGMRKKNPVASCPQSSSFSHFTTKWAATARSSNSRAMPCASPWYRERINSMSRSSLTAGSCLGTCHATWACSTYPFALLNQRTRHLLKSKGARRLPPQIPLRARHRNLQVSHLSLVHRGFPQGAKFSKDRTWTMRRCRRSLWR